MRADLLVASAGALALAASLAVAGSDDGSAEEYVPDVQTEMLHKAPLPGMDGKEMIVVRITAPPGFVGERHIHPGPVFMYVLDGEVTVETEGETQTVTSGELWPEPVDTPMVPRNASDTAPAHLIVFQIGDIGEPMMLKAE